ncbi:metal-dependent hydrolase [Aquimarina addita]|uniref:Metal-dependent hydrolase n=1 Tax=Aquimarina addita TaxID=870485 RepID=A0ABP6UJV3_9FLAO
MASIFGHAFAAFALSTSFSKEIATPKFWILGIICAIIPDADVIGFRFNIAYESFWGHRGFSHSLVFALLLGILVTLIFYSHKIRNKTGILLILYFTLCTASHGILDALTSGGKGVAFFSPLDTTRYFFPWRPIKVSPIGASRFFSMRGVNVLLSEFIWIAIPAIIYILVASLLRKKNDKH